MTKKSKSSKSSSSKDKHLNVVCSTCGAFKGKTCKHTKGSKEGHRRDTPHQDRIRLAAVKLTDNQKERISKAATDDKPAKKNPREKLTAEQKEVVQVVSEKIEALGKSVEFVGPVSVGPIVSTYRFFPLRRTKVAHLESCANDFAVALGAEQILVKRMPGESAVGVFVPNRERQTIKFEDTLENVAKFMKIVPADGHKPIPVNFGVDQNGEPYVDDLTMMPHLLVAGTTGSGKSTFQHCVVQSMTYALRPDELRMFISDTKGVEFKVFRDLPHLLAPIATDVYKTMAFLQQCCDETQNRLDLFGVANVRNIHEYNAKIAKGDLAKKLPYIVIVIDELADIMGPALERSEAKANSDKLGIIVARSRASGIHCIAATQRPDVKQIKGSIKANFPARLSFRLPSQQDSKTILSTKGAEKLMSRGDMLYINPMSPELKRLHAPYTSLDETKSMLEMIVARENAKNEDSEEKLAPNNKFSADDFYQTN